VTFVCKEQAMMFSRTAVVVLGALAGTAAAVFVGARRRVDRANALEGRVEVQDWESAPLKGTVPGAKLPPPEEVAKDVTGVTPAKSVANPTGM
jgi:hypothetical protein